MIIIKIFDVVLSNWFKVAAMADFQSGLQLRKDPGIAFWLRWVELQGGLAEDEIDRSTVLLPPALQSELALAEEVVITNDPGLAREEGALLLAPGHPVLELSVTKVLEAGDVGYGYIPWPQGPPMSPSALETRLRNLITIDHGRLEVVGQPNSAYLPVIRIGALVRYSLSIGQSFQEEEEVWADARTGSALSEKVLCEIATRSLVEGKPSDRPLMSWDQGILMPKLHQLLEAKARRRQQVLAMQVADMLKDEVARADAYYSAALDSIAHRASKALPERRSLLEAQAEATRAEAERRRRELREQHEPVHEIRPFLLHLIGIPALSVQLAVRRGERSYPITITWLASLRTALTPTCPRCGSQSILVAGRRELGCRECQLPQTGSAGSATHKSDKKVAPELDVHRADKQEELDMQTLVPLELHSKSNQPSLFDRDLFERSDTAQIARPITTGDREMERDAQKSASPRLPSSTPAKAQPSGPSAFSKKAHSQSAKSNISQKSSGRVTIKATSRAQKACNNLALTLWESVAMNRRWKSHDSVSHSPLSALLRLYRSPGLGYAIGIRPGELITDIETTTPPMYLKGRMFTFGTVYTEGASYSYFLRWRMIGFRPLAAEILPDTQFDLIKLAELNPTIQKRLKEHAPPPSARDLDAVATELWRLHIRWGIPLVARYLALWWWAIDVCHDDVADLSVGEITEAIISLVMATVSGTPIQINALPSRTRPFVSILVNAPLFEN